MKAPRRAWQGFAQVGARRGVQRVHRLHRGPVPGSNRAGPMHLLRGVDPRRVGAHRDPGHRVPDGEDHAMGLAMVREPLSVGGVKDAVHAPQPGGSEPPFLPRFVRLGRGAVNRRRARGALKGLGFDGVFPVPTEYDVDETIIRQVGHADETPPHLEDRARTDAVCRRIRAEASA